MKTPPNNRAMQSGEVVTRDSQHQVGAVVGGKRQTDTVVQAHRAIATVRDVLGRDPKANVMAGGTGLISIPVTRHPSPAPSK